jgi:Zn-dependent M28 family amino/carboxypeptidase
VIGDLRGREKPDEIVIVGGHSDTWDLGQGAQDDGSGVMASLEAVLLIKKLGLQPRRTIRVLFFVNEENGGAGDRAYGAMIGDAVKSHVAAIVDDRGAEQPTGFGFGARDQDKKTPMAFQRATEIGKLLDSIGAGKITTGGGGGHIPSVTSHGVPGFGIQTVNVNYEQTNHTNADSFDKIVAHDFQLHVAAIAVLSYVCADMPERIGDLK